VILPSKGSALHARAGLVIPWLVNGSLPAEAEQAVREHIAACPECREDYEEQLRVCQAMRAEGPLVFAAESSFQKLRTRIQSTEAGDEPLEEEAVDAPPVRAPRPFRRSAPVVRWLAAAVILQAFALGLGAWAWHSSAGSRGNNYTTLTSPPPAYESSLRVRVLFRPDLSVAALQGVLQAAGARIIDGPADGNVYTLAFARATGSRAALAKQIAALRTNPAILFAEPVQEGVR
jgi:hypothetical protein